MRKILLAIGVWLIHGDLATRIATELMSVIWDNRKQFQAPEELDYYILSLATFGVSHFEEGTRTSDNE